MSAYRPGQVLRLTKDQRRATVWSAAPGAGCYWCHVEGIEGVVLVRVRNLRSMSVPEVALMEES